MWSSLAHNSEWQSFSQTSHKACVCYGVELSDKLEETSSPFPDILTDPLQTLRNESFDANWGWSFGIGLPLVIVTLFGFLFTIDGLVAGLWPKVGEGVDQKDAILGPFATGWVVLKAALLVLWEVALAYAAIAAVVVIFILLIFGVLRIVKAVPDSKEGGKVVSTEDEEMAMELSEEGECSKLDGDSVAEEAHDGMTASVWDRICAAIISASSE